MIVLPDGLHSCFPITICGEITASGTSCYLSLLLSGRSNSFTWLQFLTSTLGHRGYSQLAAKLGPHYWNIAAFARLESGA